MAFPCFFHFSIYQFQRNVLFQFLWHLVCHSISEALPLHLCWKKGLNSTKKGLFSQSVTQSVTHSVKKIMNNIRIRICSRLELWMLFIVVFVPENQIFGTLQTHQSFNLIRTLESYKKGFHILSLFFRLAGSSKLWFHYFQIFKFIWRHKYMFKKIVNYIFICILYTLCQYLYS